MKDTPIEEGDQCGELGHFSFSNLDDMTGGITAFLDPEGGTHFSLDCDGMSLDDLERVFAVLRLGAAADHALAQATAYATTYPEGGE